MSGRSPAQFAFALLALAAAATALLTRAEITYAAPEGFISSYAVANGVSRLELTYVGTTADPADELGDRIRFTVLQPAGATFDNGESSIVVPLGGEPCRETPAYSEDDCYARAFLSSTVPGAARVAVTNLELPGSGGILDAEFLLARSIVPSFHSGPTTSDVDGVAVQNAGDGTAAVVLSFVSEDGEVAKRVYESIEAGASVVYDTVDDPDLPGFIGTLTVGADQPVAVLALHSSDDPGSERYRRAIHRALPFENFDPGPRTYTLPYVANALEGAYNAKFAITNTSFEVACIRVTYHFVAGAGAVGPEGRPSLVHPGLGTGNGDCEGGALAVLPGREVYFTPAGGIGIVMPEATRNTLMSVTVEATGPVAVAVEAFTTDGTWKEASYEGFDVVADTGTEIVVPLALKTADGYYTHILFSNPGPTPVEVEVEYSGNTGTHTATRTLGPYGVSNHSTYSDDVVPSGFVGAAMVRATGPIAVVVFRAKKINPNSEIDEDLYTALNGIPIDGASNELWFPLILRRFERAPGTEGVNSWISISVPNAGTANVTLRAVGSCDDSDETFVATKQIDGSFVFYMNAETETGLGPNPPPCFYGGVLVTSDVPVVGTASYINSLHTGDGEAVYNGIVVQH